MWTQGRDNCDILDYWSWRHTSNASNISTRRNSVLTTGALVLNYENLPVSQFTLRLLQRHKWVVTSLLELFVKLSPKKQKTNRKTLIVKYTIKNFTCDLCVCEHISESRYFTSTPHAFKNIKTHIWATNNNRGNKSCTRGNFSPPLTKCNPGKNVINNMAMSLTKILPGFTINILGNIFSGSFLQQAQIRHSSDCHVWTKV